jgi:hypothetical protein
MLLPLVAAKQASNSFSDVHDWAPATRRVNRLIACSWVDSSAGRSTFVEQTRVILQVPNDTRCKSRWNDRFLSEGSADRTCVLRQSG